MRIKSFLLILLLVLLTIPVAAQLDPQRNVLGVNITATVQVPADQIIFTVNINAQGETPREAFETHKEREALLAELLKEFDIEEENISFEPIRIDKRNRNNSDSQYSITSQQVSVLFSDFDIYEEIQVALIEGDFDNFSGSFSSTQLEEGKEEALKTAIEEAKKRATLIAESAGVTLLGIISINNYDQVSARRLSSAPRMEQMVITSSSMMDFDQMVDVVSTVQMQFEIQDN